MSWNGYPGRKKRESQMYLDRRYSYRYERNFSEGSTHCNKHEWWRKVDRDHGKSVCLSHTRARAHALSPHYFLFVNTIYINQLKNKNICLYILRRYVMVVRVRVLNVSLILLHTRYIVGFKSKHNVT